MKIRLQTDAQFSHQQSKASEPVTTCTLHCAIVGMCIPLTEFTMNRLKPIIADYHLRVDMLDPEVDTYLFETVGIAHLKEGDTKNLELAEKYAESKASRKAYKVVKRIIKILQPEYTRLESALYDAEDNFLDYIQHEEQHIEELKKQ